MPQINIELLEAVHGRNQSTDRKGDGKIWMHLSDRNLHYSVDILPFQVFAIFLQGPTFEKQVLAHCVSK